MQKFLINWMERGWLPDALIERGIRSLLKERLAQESTRDIDTFYRDLAAGPVAIETAAANEQHYEVPAIFFQKVLGPRLKYSSCFWEMKDGKVDPSDTLEKAEERMLALTCERAQIEDGHSILELGCGWGSLSLWMAETYPNARITTVSNSASQAAFIRKRAQDRGIRNLSVHTCDANIFSQPEGRFDRVVSVEMFAHMRNHRELLNRIHGWLKPDGKLFVHIFTHKQLAYPFEVTGDQSDWMSRYFFTGGIMPSHDIFERVTDDFRVEEDWMVNGVHYGLSLRAWLAKQDAQKDELMPFFKEVYGESEGAKWFERWRVFWLACAELFEYNQGKEWQVSHYLMKKIK